MRILLALLLMVPVWAQQPEQAKPDEKAAQSPAKADEKAAAPAEQKAEAKADDKAAAASPAPAVESAVSGSVDFGYRWVTDIRGNAQQYRSVVNLGEGPKIFGVDLTVQDPKKRLFDRLDIFGRGWGGDPYTTARIAARKMKLYDFRFDYRNIAYFNAVPSFANNRTPSGFDEQSFDTRRRAASFELDLFPAGRIVPYLAYDRNSGSGHGIETWVQDANNQYAVPVTLRDSTNNYRGGVRIGFNHLHLTLEQGGTTYKDDDQTNWSGANLGDRTTPSLGQTLSLNKLQQAYGIRGSSIYTRAMLTANVGPNIDFYGQFLFSEPRSDVHFAEVANGNFVQISQLLFYSGLYTLGTGTANQPHTTGNFGVEIRPAKRVRIVQSWLLDRYHDGSSPLVAQQLFLTATTAGSNSTTALNFSQVVNYNQQQTDLFFDLTSKITARAGYRYVWGNATVLAGNLSQVGPTVSGQLRRQVALTGLSVRPSQKFSMNLDYEAASGDSVYFRTSLNDYHKARVRAKYTPTNNLTFQANFQVLNNQNPGAAVQYDFQSRDNSLAVFWNPASGKRITLMAEYDRSTVKSRINYLLPPFLTPSISNYRENAHSATTAIDFMVPGWANAKVTAGGSLFLSGGSRPTRYYQPLVRMALPLHKHLYWNTEWQYYGFGEDLYQFEGFRTHVFMTGLRVTR